MSEPARTGRAGAVRAQTTPLHRVRWWSAALVVVFAVHNAEELVGLPSLLASVRPPAVAGWTDLYRPDRFLTAVAVLTVLVMAMLVPAAVRGTPRATVVALLAVGGVLSVPTILAALLLANVLLR